ncbi:hypothetical protein AMTR_s01512p00007620, partial [Amborella trichopoda]
SWVFKHFKTLRQEQRIPPVHAVQKDIGIEEEDGVVLDRESFETALCRTYVIFDNIVDRYLPDWVLRQYGL